MRPTVTQYKDELLFVAVDLGVTGEFKATDPDGVGEPVLFALWKRTIARLVQRHGELSTVPGRRFALLKEDEKRAYLPPSDAFSFQTFCAQFARSSAKSVSRSRH